MEEEDPREYQAKQPGGFFFAGWIGAIALVLIATAGLVLARDFWIGRQASELAKRSEAGPHVLVAQVLHPSGVREVKLPATLRGFDETDVFAKIPGYMKKINVDKGDKIRAGQVIAIIESPETDQQVATPARTTTRDGHRPAPALLDGAVIPQTYHGEPTNLLQTKACWISSSHCRNTRSSPRPSTAS